MDIYLGKPRGFCAGVVRAIEIAEHSIKKFGSPVYIKHQIVHNPHVVTALEKKGATLTKQYTMESSLPEMQG